MRRVVLVVVTAGLLLTAGCDWPMFHNVPGRSGDSPDTSITPAALTSGSVMQSWSALTGYPVTSSPAVAAGVVYVGSQDSRLYAFDGAAGNATCTGAQPNRTCSALWSGATGGFVESSPAVSGRVVYVGSDDHQLYAFDAGGGNATCSGAAPTRSCAPMWTASTGNNVISSPAVVNNVVYVASRDGKLYAFDANGGNATCTGTTPARTCTPLWTAATTNAVDSSPAVANGVVYVGSTDHKLYAFDAAGGDATCTGITPARTCTPLWTATTADAVVSSPAVTNGVVYVGSDDAKLYAFDAAGGNATCSGTAPSRTCLPLWTAPTGNGIESSPAVAGGVVYVGSDDLMLYAFDAAGGNTTCAGVAPARTCAPLWTGATGDIVTSSPAVAGGVVYVGSTDHKLYTFDALGGNASCTGTAPARVCAPLWTASMGSDVRSSPAIANSTVYIGSDDHRLYAYAPERIPPTTAVVQPANDAAVSGITTLVASASDDVAVSKVEFRLSGGGLNDAVIGTAVLYYGWDDNWDTTTVPNGVYTLSSVAYDPAGNAGRSTTVTITVKN